MKKKLSIIMVVTLAVSTALFGCGKKTAEDSSASSDTAKESNLFETTEESSQSSSELSEGAKITVITHHLSCRQDGKELASGIYPEILLEEGYGADYPQLKRFLERYNEDLKNQITESTTQYGGWALEETFYDDPDFSSELNVTVVRADDRLFTMLFSYFDWAGGAHPSHGVYSVNVDPVTGTELTLNEILADSSRLSEGIRTSLEKEYPGIMEEVDSFYFQDEDDDPDQFVNKLKENTYTFTVTDKGLQIFFSPYEIASYAAGEMDVTLSYDEYPELVQKAYVMKEARDMDKVVSLVDDTDNVSILEPTSETEDIAQEQYVDNPSWNYYLSDAASPKAGKHISLTKLTEKKTDWLDTWDWCNRNGFEQANLNHEDDFFYYSPYYPVEYDYMYNGLYIYDKDMTEMLYNFNLLKICNGPDDEAGVLPGATEYIRYALVYDGKLYVEVAHSGYASEEPKTGYMLAIDLATSKVLFRSEPLVANSNNFKIVDDTIICGYGFTAEPDYIYLLDRFTGEKVETIPINSAADQFEIVGDTLYVATYNTEYTFKIEK